MEIFFRVENRIINVKTGERADLVKAKKGIIIEYTLNSFHLKRPKKPKNMKYVYRSKKTKTYIASPILSTTFLRDVLYDYLGIKAVAVTAPYLAIAFFGENQEYLISKDEDEKQKFLEKVFQGIEYKTISVEEAVKLVIFDRKKVVLGVLLLFLFSLSFTFFLLSGEEDDVNQIKPFKPVNTGKKLILQPEKEAVEKTLSILEALNGYIPKPYEYIEKIDFSSGKVYIKSAIPQESFLKQGKWYIGNFSISQKKIAPYKEYNQCYKLVRDFGGEVKTFDRRKVVFEINTEKSVEEVEEFLKNLQGCPVALNGYIYQYQPLKVSVKLKAEVFHQF